MKGLDARGELNGSVTGASPVAHSMAGRNTRHLFAHLFEWRRQASATSSVIHEAAWGVGAAALASLSAAWILQLWRAALNVPLTAYSSDAVLYYVSVKGAAEHGWYDSNPSLAAPFGQVNYDFPIYVGDTLNVLIAKTLAVLSSSAVTGLNLFILLGFPLAAFTAYLVMRKLTLTRPVALVCATLFALTPYHFIRLPAHVFLASYFGIPLGVYLLLSVLTGRPLFEARAEEPWWRRWVTPKSGSTLIVAAIVGSTDLYYAVFTILLLIASGPLAAIPRRRLAPVLSALIVSAGITLVVLLSAVPEISYHFTHGSNPMVAKRQPWQSELFGLKLAKLVLPIPQHRIPPLADLRASYEVNPIVPSTTAGTDPLGAIGTIGLIWLGLVLLARALVNRPRRLNRIEAATAVAAAMAFVLATVGGVSAVIALFNPQIRAWDRITPFMAFFALLGVGFLLERACRHLRRQWAGRTLVGSLLAVVFVVALLDGTSDAFVPNYALTAAQFHADAALVHRVERTLPAGAEVLELPYVPYPEAAAGHLDSYTELQPYLQSHHLRWSAGAMEGRPQDWLARVADRPVIEIVRDAAVVGFSGVWIERQGYADGGTGEAEAIHRLTGGRIFAEPLGRAYFLDLRAYGRKLQATHGTARLAEIKHKTLFADAQQK